MYRPSHDIHALQASVLKTLASPRRLEMVELLKDGPWEVRRLAEYFAMSQPAISQHLAAMRSAGLVESIRDGRDVRYQLADPEIVAACELMRRVLVRRITRLGDLAASFAVAPALEPIPVPETV